MFNKKTIRDINFQGKRVLIRVDYNVPIKEGVISDDTRIKASLPTLNYLLDQGASLILCSHLGRPKGQPDLTYSLEPVAAYLGKILGKKVAFSKDCIGPTAVSAVEALTPGDVLVLENTRFHQGETKNDPEFSQQLASLGDVFVNDAFGTAHRAHGSNVGVAGYIPAVAGFLLEKEIKYLGQAVNDPKRPFVAILGGAKISDKIGVIRNLLTKADHILIGGGMANTFFQAQGYATGDSLVEEEALSTARELLDVGGTKLRLPIDVVVADKFDNDAESKVESMGPIMDHWRILDIGPETVSVYSKIIIEAGTVVWNGPMGVFEFDNFAKGTFGVAQAVAKCNGVTIIGGGDSVAAINAAGLGEKITHISTGGGASLEMLEGLMLPGLSALQDK